MPHKIALLTVLVDDVPKMVEFYKTVLGFTVDIDMGQYVEFSEQGIRFAVCARSVLEEATGYADFRTKPSGQAYGLAFPCESVDVIDDVYDELIVKGATPVAAPKPMPWGQQTGFFADPEGNVHELFTDL